MNDWHIQSRAHHCTACGKAFVDQQAYHTLLFDEKRAFLRLDLCDPCWKSQYSQGGSDRKGFISYWQGTYEAPPPPSADPIQKETAETLLRKIIERNEPQYAAAAFILAVMLERKRLLKVKEQFVRDGQRVFVYEQPKTGDVLTVPDPNLQLDQLQQVQADVAHLLEHGLPVETPAPGIPPTPPPPAETAPSESTASEPVAAAEFPAPAPSEQAPATS